MDWYLNAFVVDCAQSEINALKYVFLDVQLNAFHFSCTTHPRSGCSLTHWSSSSVMSHRIVWPRSVVLLCLWYVRRAWQKQSCAKITSLALCATVLEEMGSIMYDREGPRGADAKHWAMLKLLNSMKKYLVATDFWRYVEEQWLFQIDMWVVGYRELPYAVQDTNVAIEGYHSTLKATLKSRKCHMLGRRVDWLIHELTGEVLSHFWYQCLKKRFGFVINKRQEYIVVGALMKARNILDINVNLPTEDGALAIVRSCTKPNMLYTVFKPRSKWACYMCSQTNREYICKHKLKVLRMLKPDVEEGSIARLCGSLKGTVHGGVDKFFAEKPDSTIPTVHGIGNYSTELREPEFGELRETESMEDQVCTVVQQMVEDAKGNDVLMRHLLVGILYVKGS